MSKHSIQIDNAEYLSTRAAGSEFGYTKDHVGRLCRDGDLTCRRSGRTWVVSRASLEAFRAHQEHEQLARARELSIQRKREYRTRCAAGAGGRERVVAVRDNQQGHPGLHHHGRHGLAPVAQPATVTMFRRKLAEAHERERAAPQLPLLRESIIGALVHKATALAAAIVLVGGTFTVADVHYGTGVVPQLAASYTERVADATTTAPRAFAHAAARFDHAALSVATFVTQDGGPLAPILRAAREDVPRLAYAFQRNVARSFDSTRAALRSVSPRSLTASAQGNAPAFVHGNAQTKTVSSLPVSPSPSAMGIAAPQPAPTLAKSVGGGSGLSDDDLKYVLRGRPVRDAKEEVAVKFMLDERDTRRGFYVHVVDFDELAEGSDLSRFYRSADFGEDWEHLVVTLTAAFQGGTFYEENPRQNTITIYATKPGMVSARFLANPDDADK